MSNKNEEDLGNEVNLRFRNNSEQKFDRCLICNKKIVSLSSQSIYCPEHFELLNCQQRSQIPILTKIKQAEKLKYEYKYQDALDILTAIEILSDLDEKIKRAYKFLQCELLIESNQYSEALTVANECIVLSKVTGNNLWILDASLLLGRIYCFIGNANDLSKIIINCEDILLTIHDKKENQIGFRKLKIYHLQFWNAWKKGDNNKSVKFAERQLEISKKYGTNLEISKSYYNLGFIYMEIGEFEKAIVNFNHCLLLSNEIGYKIGLCAVYNNLGIIYSNQGEIDEASEFYKKGLKIATEMNNIRWLSMIYPNIGYIYFEKGDFEKCLKYCLKGLQYNIIIQNKFKNTLLYLYIIETYAIQSKLSEAQHYFEELRKIYSQNNNKRILHRLSLSEALILKCKGGSRNIHKAQNILKDLLKEEKDEENSIENEILIKALLYLCDLLMDELQITNEFEILNELSDLLPKLYEIALKEKLFLIMVEYFFFQAKIQLLHLNSNEARKLFTQAQHLAQRYNLQRLEKKISIEHDHVLTNLEKWNELKQNNAPFSDRMQLASIKGDLAMLMKRKEILNIKIIPEQPLLLTFILKSGMSIYSHYFKENWAEEWQGKQLISSFMTAFNAFSDELFNQTLDRVKAGDNTIIIASIMDIHICYIHKGQTYSAQQRLNQFIQEIQNSQHLQEVIKDAIESDTEQILKLNPILEKTSE